MRLNHVNIRCSDLEATLAFLEATTDLTVGPRPDFGIPGFWLYNTSGQAIVHLIGTRRSPGHDGTIDHVAFEVVDLGAHLDRLRALGYDTPPFVVPGTDVHQCFVEGPDGLHLEFQGPISGAVASRA